VASKKKLSLQLGEKIKAAREGKGLTAEQLAEQAGISAQQLWRIESGRSKVTAVALARIAKAVGTPIEKFVDHITRAQENAERLWEQHQVSLKVSGSRPANWKTKMQILKAMGLWEE